MASCGSFDINTHLQMIVVIIFGKMILLIDAVPLDYLAVDGELRLCAQVADDVTHFDVKAQVLAVLHL